MPHIHNILTHRPTIDWLEVPICNFLTSSVNQRLLLEVKESYPLSFHGVNLNLGGCDPLDRTYLNDLKHCIDQFTPVLVSDHACFTRHTYHYNDLLPIPYTAEAVAHLSSRIRDVQDHIEQTLLLENVSRYSSYPESDLSEAEFLTAVADESGCDLLLDINNAYVNEVNHGESALAFIQALPRHKIKEIHLAGHHRQGHLLIDSHSTPVAQPVWQLFKTFCASGASIPTLIERDNELPPLTELLGERDRAQSIAGTAYHPDADHTHSTSERDAEVISHER